MKKLILMLLCVCMLGTFPVGAASTEAPVTLTVNDLYIAMDTEAFLHRGLTYVPIRFVSHAMGADSVTWHEPSSTATIVCDGTTISLTKNEKQASVNGENTALDGSVLLRDGRLFVPVRFVAENLDCSVEWIFETYTVNIEKEGHHVPGELVGQRGYTDDEIYWLSRIVHAESRGEPMAGKIAVANVVLNRVKSAEYPNTIYGVIFDRNHGVQFTPIIDGSIYQSPLGDSIVAAKRALGGENVVGPCLFFLNPKKAQNYWIINNRPYYTTISGHDFYL